MPCGTAEEREETNSQAAAQGIPAAAVNYGVQMSDSTRDDDDDDVCVQPQVGS